MAGGPTDPATGAEPEPPAGSSHLTLVPPSGDAAAPGSHYPLFVDGQFTPGTGEPLTTVNPATEQTLAWVTTAGPSDVDRAVRAARRAGEKTWSRMAGAERARYLYRIAGALRDRAPELAALETLNTGKPVTRTGDLDIPRAAARFFYYAGWADKLDYAGFGPDPRPVGVVAAIVAGTAPLLLAAEKIAPALAAGNAVVLKPAETTPLSALVLAEICQRLDLPPGVLNVVTGGPEVGAHLVEAPGVDLITFTGSTEAGRQVQFAAAGTRRRLTLDLDATATHVVCDDAPLDEALDGVVTATFRDPGPRCAAGARVLAHESVIDAVVAGLRRRLAALHVGDPLRRDTEVGAVGSAHRLAAVRELTASGESEGARLWTSPAPLPERGFFVAPAMLTDVGQDMRIAREPIDGPVVAVSAFADLDEAVTRINGVPAGAAVAVWTRESGRALSVARRSRVGVVWAAAPPGADAAAPRGGLGEAGLGRTGGRSGLETYLSG